MKLRDDQLATVKSAMSAAVLGQDFKRILYGNMGSGKTVTAINAVNAYNKIRWAGAKDGGRVLVVAPVRVAREAWAKELTALGHSYTIAAGKSIVKLREALIGEPGEFVIVAPGQLAHLRKVRDFEFANKMNFTAIIIDELSLYRTAGSERVKTLRRLPKFCHFVLALTGTPVSENYHGMYSMLLCVDGGETLGTRLDKFTSTYFEVNEWEKGIPSTMRPGGAEALAAKVAPVFLSLTDRREELPAITYETQWASLPPDIQAMHDKLAKDYVLESDGEGFKGVEAANSAVLTGKLVQIASGVVYQEDEAFDDFDRERLDTACLWILHNLWTLAKGDRPATVLVPYTLRADQTRFYEVLDVHRRGETQFYSAHAEDLIVTSKDPNYLDKFGPYEEGKCPILLTHPRSLGHGVNLQGHCSYVHWLAPHWSRELTDQFNARVWRTGQKHPVLVETTAMAGTIDEAIIARLESKDDNDDTFRAYLEALRTGSTWASRAAPAPC